MNIEILKNFTKNEKIITGNFPIENPESFICSENIENQYGNSYYILEEKEPLSICGLTWSLTYGGIIGDSPWSISDNGLRLRYAIEDSQNCRGQNPYTQTGTAVAIITACKKGSQWLYVDFEGIAEFQDTNFERMEFYLNGQLLASGTSQDLNKYCDEFGPVIKRYYIQPPYLLESEKVYEFKIDFTTGDSLYHIGCYYDIFLRLESI